MPVNSKFLVVKTKDSKEIKYFDYDNIDGYNLKAKDDVHFEDAIDVNRMIIINPSFTDKIATLKLNAKFDKFISLMAAVCDMDDDTGEGYRIALDKLNKLRMELINKYKKYINDEKYELMLKKLEILEDELKLRLDVLENSLLEQRNKEQGKSR